MNLEISRFKNIVVLTGAGISAESGINTFRDSDGLWEQHRIEDVATPEAFERDPVLVWRFYSMRRIAAAKAAPNQAHSSLAQFAKAAQSSGTSIVLITQNVDMLHERAAGLERDGKQPPSSLPIAMHGTLSRSRCSRCGQVFEDVTAWFAPDGKPSAEPVFSNHLAFRGNSKLPAVDPRTTRRHPKTKVPLSVCCNEHLRPHIVWFGEMPLDMDRISLAIHDCDLFVTIGSSGQVYPAAGFIEQAKIAGAFTACLNKEPLPQQGMVDFYLEGPATQTVPTFFNIH